MEACCSFKSLVATSCGFDAKDRKRQNQIVSLVSCSKDISGPQNEIDLILCRAWLLYKTEESIKSMTVCPHHRAILGISWTRGRGTRCRVPQAISGHGRSRATWPKGNRSLVKKDSALIMNNTGLFVPPGSGNSFIEQPYSIFKPTLTCLASRLYLRTSQCICFCCHIGICKKCRFLIKGMETASSGSVVQTLGDKMRQSTVE